MKITDFKLKKKIRVRKTFVFEECLYNEFFKKCQQNKLKQSQVLSILIKKYFLEI